MKYEPLRENASSEKIVVKENMFGLKDDFFYNKTVNGSLIINEIPTDISKYYPTNYYSFNQNLKPSKVLNFFKKKRNKFSFERKGLVGGIMHYFKPEKVLDSIHDVTIFKKTSKILDVGCGDGRLLSNLYDLGYKNIKGIDPFLKVAHHKEFPIEKKSIYELDEKFDIIILYHVFEHVDQPEMALQQLKKLLNDNGVLIIAIPLADSYAFEKYQENWVQLDAPRHFYLYSSKDIVNLIKTFGLSLKKVVYNSDEFQFWGSEQYKAGISLFDVKSYLNDKNNSIFKKSDIKSFKKQSKKLNREEKGDQAVFFFKNEASI